jgi:glycosyltransferase involved in cell wall biosynthesis
MIAEYATGKRHADVLAALARLRRPDIHVAFVGDGALRSMIERQIDDLALRDRVHVLGYRKDVPLLLKASDAFLLPSEREGLPRSMLEAMAAGVPVVGTDIRGVRDLLAHGAGVCVAVGDVEGLARAIEQVADDAGLRSSLVSAAEARVRDFSLPRLLSLHERLYGTILTDPMAAAIVDLREMQS